MNGQAISQLRIVLCYVTCAILWGTGWYAIRLSVAADGYPVLAGAALRYTVAAAVLAIVFMVVPGTCGRMTRSQTAWILLSGVFNAAGMALLCWGEKSISGGLAAVLAATSPIMAAVLALLTRAERITAGTVGGFSIAFAGVVVVFGERLFVEPSHLLAMGAVLGAASFFAIVNQVMKVKVGEARPLQSSALFFVIMSVVFWAASPLESRAMPWPLPIVPTCALLYLSIGCSALAFPMFLYVLRHSSLMLASTLAFVHPVIALLTDCAVETDCVLTAGAYTGIAIVLGGVLLSCMAIDSSGRACDAAPITEPGGDSSTQAFAS